LEDAHWADPSTLDFLHRLVPGLAHAPLLLLLTARPPVPAELAALPGLRQLELGRLGPEESGRLAAAVAADRPLPSEVLAGILARADGVPLYLEELTRAVLELGPGAQAGVPASLQDSLLARL